MIKELNAASDALCAAIDRYLKACSTFRDSYAQGIALGSLPREYLGLANNELLLVTSYETKIKQAKAAIGLARSSAPAAVPIDAPPSEILTRIFYLVVSTTYNYPLHESRKTLPQDLLSHVCSRWRHIVIGARALWSHIDLPLNHRPYQNLLTRAETYVARACHLPLDIRVFTIESISQCELSSNTSLVQFFATVAPWMQSLELYAFGSLTELHCSIFQSCFAKCVPGTFVKFVLWTDEDTIDSPSRNFIEAIHNSSSAQSLLLDLPQQTLEDLWSPTTVMRLRGLYPYWTSKAYHGLVELRLISSTSRSVSIPEPQLVEILMASPGLRIFHFGLLIVDHRSVRAPIVPVRLNELEVLAFVGTWDDPEDASPIASSSFLRLLAPGTKPLTLSVVGNNYVDSERHMLNDEAKNFLARANITDLRLAGSGTYPVVAEVLRLSPGLRALTLQNFSITQNHTPASSSGGRNPQDPRFGLDALYLGGCEIDLDELRRIVQTEIEVRSLTFWDYYDPGGEELTEEMVRAASSDFCPVISFVEPEIDLSSVR